MIILIWAQDLDGGIGENNKLPWDIKEEMAHFRNTTLNHVVIMGRKTFESIGHPLAKRTNLVLTHNLDYHVENVKIYHDVNQVVKDYYNQIVYVIGGKEIYLAFAKVANQLIVSKIKRKYNCNVYMNFDFTQFVLTKTISFPLFDIEYYSCKAHE
jgi:dihydrofolate reductase